MNLTNEQIQRVFALYFGAKRQGSQLLLKPLATITDADAIEVAKMCGLVNAIIHERDFRDYNYLLLKDDSYILQISFNGYICLRKNGQLYNMNLLLVYQYLIQQGYAVPLFIAPNHPGNGKTAIELNLALDVTTLPTKQPA